MDIYVQSRGISQDYRWLKVTNKSQQRAELPIPAKVTNLIDSEASSLILGRFNESLTLLITGLEASQRIDNRNRQIRNSVAWVGQNFDEAVLRAIAVQWLRDELTVKIDKAVKSAGKEGFQISFRELQQLASTGLKGNLLPVKMQKIGNLQKLKNKLADELTQHRLPEDEGLLVVVTGINTREDFEKAGVWRGLSSLIDSEDWEPLKNHVDSDSENFIKVLSSRIYQFINEIKPIFLIIILILSLSGNVFLYQKLTTEENQKRTLENQVEELNKTKSNLKFNLNQLEEEFKFKQEKKQTLEAQLQLKQKEKENLQNRLQNLQRILEEQASYLEKIVQTLKSENRIEKIK